MNIFFLDTSNGLTVGLYKNNSWISYEQFEEKKPSEVLHRKIFEIAHKHNVLIENSTFISIAGPGSYTGMRLSEGMAQILKICGTKIFSFYHFEVPRMTGIEQGSFCTNAFKNQFFFYDWNVDEGSSYLLNADDVNFSKNVYSNMNLSLFSSVIQTSQLIKDHPEKIFNYVINRGTFLNSYYFRSLDEEFKSIC
jgi:tRNA threonylcarbamoyladenosine biosynthesis protein TsaB